MPLIGTMLNTVGVFFLTHAVYSTHEHTTTFAHAPLPLDITVELLFSILILTVGIILSSPQLKPIQWAQWAGKLSREGPQTDGKRTREGEVIFTDSDPFAFLGLDAGIGGTGEGRRSFWDVRGKRKEYEEWVKAGGKS